MPPVWTAIRSRTSTSASARCASNAAQTAAVAFVNVATCSTDRRQPCGHVHPLQHFVVLNGERRSLDVRQQERDGPEVNAPDASISSTRLSLSREGVSRWRAIAGVRATTGSPDEGASTLLRTTPRPEPERRVRPFANDPRATWQGAASRALAEPAIGPANPRRRRCVEALSSARAPATDHRRFRPPPKCRPTQNKRRITMVRGHWAERTERRRIGVYVTQRRVGRVSPETHVRERRDAVGQPAPEAAHNARPPAGGRARRIRDVPGANAVTRSLAIAAERPGRHRDTRRPYRLLATLALRCAVTARWNSRTMVGWCVRSRAAEHRAV